MSPDQTPENPPPGTDQQASVLSSSTDRRPGSNVKPVLPPIPTGRKTPTVASPALSPNPQAVEKREEEKEG